MELKQRQCRKQEKMLIYNSNPQKIRCYIYETKREFSLKKNNQRT